MEPSWWEDAVVYCVDVARFADSDGDGCGDLPGLIAHLDHVERLGATCLWLLPFYVSPRRDNGYDVADHCAVDPRLGSVDDVRRLVAELDRRGLRLVLDLVANHTSDEHPWFARALEDSRAPERAYYVFRDEGEARPEFRCIFPGERGPWEYDELGRAFYLHHFYRFQPDLDPCHRDVRAALDRIVRFWGELGVSGLRVDAAGHIVDKASRFCPQADGGHWVLRELAQQIAGGCRDGALMAEADVPVDDLGAYFGDGDEIQLLLSFLASEHLWLALARRDAEPLARMLRRLPDTPGATRFANFVRNHDELDLDQLGPDERAEVLAAFAPDPSMRTGSGIRRRAATMLDGDVDRTALAHVTMLALPGVPVLLYGDEIGLGDDLSQVERGAVRLAMQWSPEEGGGFSEAGPERLLVPLRADGPYGYRCRNVRDQEADPRSLLHRLREAIAARRAAPELTVGRCAVLEGDPRILALRFERDGSSVVAAMNLGDAEAPLPELPGPAEVLLASPGSDPHGATLPPAGYRWLRTTD